MDFISWEALATLTIRLVAGKANDKQGNIHHMSHLISSFISLPLFFPCAPPPLVSSALLQVMSIPTPEALQEALCSARPRVMSIGTQAPCKPLASSKRARTSLGPTCLYAAPLRTWLTPYRRDPT